MMRGSPCCRPFKSALPLSLTVNLMIDGLDHVAGDRAKEEVAARRIRDPEDQRKFVSLVRNTIADSVERGEPLQPVRLRKSREVPTKPPQSRTPDRDPSPAR